jgi:phospholipase C
VNGDEKEDPSRAKSEIDPHAGNASRSVSLSPAKEDIMPNTTRVLAALAAGALACGTSTSGLHKLNHIVVIVLENWSFDSLYAEAPGVEGLAGAMKAPAQIDATGAPYATLPQTETHLPQTLPNAPFALDPFLPLSDRSSTDLTNNFYEEQRQIHGGKMDQFVLFDAAGKGLTMGYYHTSGLPLAAEAQKYTLCDHFFHGVYGGSLQNHIFLVSAAVARFPNAPASIKRAVLDANGVPVATRTANRRTGR